MLSASDAMCVSSSLRERKRRASQSATVAECFHFSFKQSSRSFASEKIQISTSRRRQSFREKYSEFI